MNKGCFITIEGVEGVGKSSNIAALESILVDHDIKFISTREPGGTPLAEKIRALLLDKNESSMTDMTELLLVFAARAQHVEALIKPALARGDWVICDRFTDSSFAYQGAGREANFELIADLERLALQSFSPDLTFLLDLPVDVGLARASQRGELDRFEKEDMAFFNRVRRGYLDRAKQADRFRVIDASQSLVAVKAEIEVELKAWIVRWPKELRSKELRSKELGSKGEGR